MTDRTETYHYTAVYKDKVYVMGKLTYTPEMHTYGEVCRMIAEGYREIAETFEFEGIVADNDWENEDGSDSDATGG